MRFTLTTAAVAAALSVPTATTAQDNSAELDALRAELTQIRAELRAVQANGTAAEAREEMAELKAAVDAAMKDAETRIQYAPDSLTAGHNGKFFLESPEDNFLLNIGGQIQGRYVFNSRDGQPGTSLTTANDLAGFQLRRIKLKFGGYIGDPKITYAVTLAANRDTADVGLELAAVGYTFDNGVKISAGRFKSPFSLDELISSSRQLAAERSAVNDIFTIGYTEGIMLEYKPVDGTKLRFSFNDGAGAGEIGFNSSDFNENNVDFAVTGRVDQVLIGDKKAKIKEYTSTQKDDATLILGGAFHHEQVKTGVLGSAIGSAGAGLDSFQRYTADLVYKNAGLNAGAAVYFETQQAVDGVAEADPFGFQFQGGYRFANNWEPFFRYEYVDPDTALEDFGIITFGVNYYQIKHASKFTLDFQFGIDSLSGVSDGAGLANDIPGEDGQFAIRAQYQLLF
ncbi:MAG: porin [Planctomycetota bacterium]